MIQNRSILVFFESNRYVIWICGLILRIIVTALNIDAWDYPRHRLPLAEGIAEGKGLYSDLPYNQMPIYPYLSAFMYLLIGDQNEVITAMAIKFPQALADAIIPVYLYKIGKLLQRDRTAILSSTLYTFNPVSINEVSVATFHSIASLFLLLAIYYFLKERSFTVGILVALGFFTSEYPILVMGSVLVFWRREIKKLILVGVGFTFTSFGILSLVLIPYNTSIQLMVESLQMHPVIKGYERGLVPEAREYLETWFFISDSLWYDLWLFSSFILFILPLLLALNSADNSKIISVITMHITLISLFFISNHTKHILWALPLVIYWGIDHKAKRELLSILLIVGYILRRLGEEHIHQILGIAQIILGISGFWIIGFIIKDLAKPVSL
jgi:4-amino-4-deoxy-L-arabinose transferase-like glycosyltransferase